MIKAKNIENDLDFLRKVSLPVEMDDKDLQKDVHELEEYCLNHEVLAMASNQIGILKRIVYLKNTDLERVNRKINNTFTKEDEEYNEARILINPVIREKIGLVEYWESCESCLNFIGCVKRPYLIKLEYLDLEGNLHLEDFKEFEAVVLSHEIDHLNGILHIDKASEIYEMDVEERKIFRQSHPYKIHIKSGDFSDLLENFKVDN